MSNLQYTGGRFTVCVHGVELPGYYIKLQEAQERAATLAQAGAVDVEIRQQPVRVTSDMRLRAPVDGIWTALSYEGGPDIGRRIPMVYQDVTMYRDHEFVPQAAAAAMDGKPLVLNIEDQGLNGTWWGDPERDNPEIYRRGTAYALDRLATAQAAGATVALWSRPAQNSYTHAWKPGNPRHDDYMAMLDRSQSLIDAQDFLAIELYWPATHEEHAEKGWPLEQLLKRGDYFIEHMQERSGGKPVVVYLSPTWGALPGNHVPADWLAEAVEYFSGREGVGIVVWGGYRLKWDDAPQAMQDVLLDMTREVLDVEEEDR